MSYLFLSLQETKFTYEEDSHPELFFIPYVWGLAIAYTDDLSWEKSMIKVFQPDSSSLYLI
jgi:hypothetical protein